MLVQQQQALGAEVVVVAYRPLAAAAEGVVEATVVEPATTVAELVVGANGACPPAEVAVEAVVARQGLILVQLIYSPES